MFIIDNFSSENNTTDKCLNAGDIAQLTNYYLKNIHKGYTEKLSPDDIFFLDIETTGLSSKNSSIYLIGIIYYTEGIANKKQWFAKDIHEEASVLSDFLDFTSGFKAVIHFNGTRFDIPFIRNRLTYHTLNDFNIFYEIDLYKIIKSISGVLPLTSFKQTDVENFLKIERNSHNNADTERLVDYDGSKLIRLYRAYQENPSKDVLDTLIFHNSNDLTNMTKIISLCSYMYLFNDDFSICNLTCTSNADCLLFEFDIESELPFASNISKNCICHSFSDMPDCSDKSEIYLLRISNNHGVFKTPVNNGQIKLFFKDYKNYYYLPLEDYCIHKSVASFVDRSRRIKATKDNCYTKIKADEAFLADSSQLSKYVKMNISSLIMM